MLFCALKDMRQFYVYIMTNKAGTTLYTGVTNNLERRVHEHKIKRVPGFTSRYSLTTLVYYEASPYIDVAISREKQIKGWTRAKKIDLIASQNPTWSDLSADWFAPGSNGDRDSSLRSE